MPDSPPDPGLSPFAHTLGELVRGDARTVAADCPAVEAAQRMVEEAIGSLVVLEGGAPVGIVTKSDLVARVLASRQPGTVPVGRILTRDPVTVQAAQPIFDGLMLMLRHHIGHLIVLDEERLAGVVSERDWLTFQERHPAALLIRFDEAASIEELAALRGRAQHMVRDLFGSEGTAAALTRFVTEINDRVARRVIALCLAELRREHGEAGAPPVAFAWIAMGSEGRAEQTLSTDQDNGLVFADVPAAEEPAVQAWFLRLAARVVDGLEQCGFPRCKGNVMGSNPELCQPLGAWQRKFAGYVRAADPEALLRASIYFDFRCLFGDAALVAALWEDLLARMRTERGFLRHLAGQVMEGRPPIHTFGWRWRALLGLRQPPLDLKRQALAPLVAAVRVLALAAGSARTHTLHRLEDAEAAGVLPDDLAAASRRAYDLLMLLRIRQQFAQAGRGEEPSNLLHAGGLDALQRRIVEEALQTVIDLQDHVFNEFGGVPVV